MAFTQLSRPSWSQGFARSAGESAFPGRWTGLRGAWPTSLGPTGDTLFDVSGNKNNGTLDSDMDPATDWTIQEGQYVLTYSTNQGVRVGNFSSSIFSADATVVASARLTSTVGNKTLFDKRTGNNAGFLILIDDGVIESAWDATDVVQGTLTVNVWHHIAVTRSGSTVKHFLDGVQVGSDGTASEDASNTNQAIIAGRSFSGLANSWIGQIGPLLVYDRALAPNEIQQLHVDPLAPFRRRRRFIFKSPVAPDIDHVAAIAIEPLGLVTLPPSVTSY